MGVKLSDTIHLVGIPLGVLAVGWIFHEFTHFVVNYIATGGHPNMCANGFPFKLDGVVLVSCFGYGGMPVFNRVLTVILTILLAAGIVYWSQFYHGSTGVGLLFGGLLLWVFYAVYGVSGMFWDPFLVNDSVYIYQESGIGGLVPIFAVIGLTLWVIGKRLHGSEELHPHKFWWIKA